MTRKDILDDANKLLERYEVEFQDNGFSFSVTDKTIISEDEQNSVFFAQGDDAGIIIRDARKYCRHWLTPEQAVVRYLDSAGALE